MRIILLKVRCITTQNRAFYVLNKYTWHAEQTCIQRCKNKKILKHCTLILIKLNNQGICIPGKPCDMCDHIINKYKIKKVIIPSETHE